MDSEIAKFSVKGLCAAPFTCMSDDGTVDLSGIAAQVAELKRGGVKYAFKREALAEQWVKDCGDDLGVIVHVGCESIVDSERLAAHAKKINAVAIGYMPPPFFRTANLDVLVQLMCRVGAAADTLPLYYYHIPFMTGANYDMDDFLEAIHGRCPTFRGLKYTDFNLYVFNNCVRFADRAYDILYGRDEQMLSAYAAGARGFVGSTYNYMGSVYQESLRLAAAGDLEAAFLQQAKSCDVVDVLQKGGKWFGPGTNVGKEILALRIEQQSGKPWPRASRLPCQPMSEEARSLLKAKLEKLGFFDW